jgi:hypothetical protein
MRCGYSVLVIPILSPCHPECRSCFSYEERNRFLTRQKPRVRNDDAGTTGRLQTRRAPLCLGRILLAPPLHTLGVHLSRGYYASNLIKLWLGRLSDVCVLDF